VQACALSPSLPTVVAGRSMRTTLRRSMGVAMMTASHGTALMEASRSAIWGAARGGGRGGVPVKQRAGRLSRRPCCDDVVGARALRSAAGGADGGLAAHLLLVVAHGWDELAEVQVLAVGQQHGAPQVGAGVHNLSGAVLLCRKLKCGQAGGCEGGMLCRFNQARRRPRSPVLRGGSWEPCSGSRLGDSFGVP
jgi:hypothetical protein